MLPTERRLRLLLLLAVCVVPSAACSVNGEKIVKVADLPDTPDFQTNVSSPYGPPRPELKHVDIGYVWTQDKLLECPVINTNGRYVGYIGSASTYVKLDPAEVRELAAKANVTLPASPALPFWDAWGGKLALLSVPLLLGLSWAADTRLGAARRLDRVPPEAAAPELGPFIAAYRTPSRPTLMLLLGYAVPLGLLALGAIAVVGLARAGSLGVAIIVVPAFLVPAGMLWVFMSAWTRGHSVSLYEGGLLREFGKEPLKFRYEDLASVSVSGLGTSVVGLPVSKSYFVRFSPRYDHAFTYEIDSRADLERLLGALRARGVRIEG